MTDQRRPTSYIIVAELIAGRAKWHAKPDY